MAASFLPSRSQVNYHLRAGFPDNPSPIAFPVAHFLLRLCFIFFKPLSTFQKYFLFVDVLVASLPPVCKLREAEASCRSRLSSQPLEQRVAWRRCSAH